jgi:tetratricopeptide (TPR) repeat protein
MAQFEEALRLVPNYAQAHHNLAALLQLAGRYDQALDHYRRAVALRPDNDDSRTNLARLLSSLGRPAEAAGHFRAALALKRDNPQALSGLGWIRAAAADPALRDAEEAVRLTEQADAATGHRDVSVLDALAAAYASAGRFDEAVAVARQGAVLATQAGLTAVATEFRQRQDLYAHHKPYRMPSAGK